MFISCFVIAFAFALALGLSLGDKSEDCEGSVEEGLSASAGNFFSVLARFKAAWPSGSGAFDALALPGLALAAEGLPALTSSSSVA